ncbi:hypothetical protein T310_8073 [Rasamsonia emersonii CBS 393.64]|uniref:STE24 endopeptidase n=1 Tax=Rasamsonia emersonii (strain ATCC 16479 / CBS 393.64 / IMI 116815) TaxID=1408163 RepID=A0A0F4YK55_RASE3|nr:hypothetical protein T310_8073 [Rasamsonia emersonii CBS 393.64]KKA17983.1 hypothetical protein T310_8073 [Rasamsonia emersonii CBS 393.64]
MPTPLDRMLNSKNLLLGFAGIVTAVAAWGIWGGDIFPAEGDPRGNPDDWTIEELRRWLRTVERASAGRRCIAGGPAGAGQSKYASAIIKFVTDSSKRRSVLRRMTIWRTVFGP